MNNKLDISRIIFISAGFLCGLMAFFFGGPYIDGNIETLQSMVTVFSIFAAIMIAIIGVLGDPTLLLHGGWRVKSADRRQIRRVLHRYTLLFYTYLIAIILLVAAILSNADNIVTSNADNIVTSNADNIATTWSNILERIALGFATAAFVWSLNLPQSLVNAQLKRLDQEVEKQKKSVGISH